MAATLALAGLTLTGSATAEAATIPPPIHVTGTLVLHIALRSAVSSGTQVQISASVTAGDSDYSNESDSYPNTVVTVANGQADTTITIPYSWTVGSTSDTVTVAVYANSAVDAAGQGDTSYPTASFRVPANGATTQVDIVGGI